jgi:glycosyltransferase involved in cell wall biosynthesis
MRLLFVSGTTVGGSGRSQRELAARLAARGHEVLFLVDAGEPARARRWSYEQLSDLSARLDGRRARRVILPLEALPGRRTRRREIGGIHHLTTPVPENAFRQVAEGFRPDVVLGNSVLRLTWRQVRRDCVQMGIATVLYVREVAALNHFDPGGDPADRVLANATSIAEEVRRMGHQCALVPSLIETSVTRTETTREVALVVNPIESHGVELVWAMASRLREVPFVILESWPLTSAERDALEARAAALPNVTLRAAAPAGPHLYRDARVLLVPHRIDNRPRVVAEAQANGIPVIASRLPGLEEAVGPGGLLLDMDDAEAWCDALRELWCDEGAYDVLARRALEHSRRPDIDPDVVTDLVESAITGALRGRRPSA